MFLNESEASKVEVDSKYRVIKLKDGKVDFSKFEITTFKNNEVFKIIRNANNKADKRTRPQYSGP